MIVKELSLAQLEELKANYVCDVLHPDEDASYDDIADANDIPDKEVFDYYAGVDFSEDDFFSK